MARTSIHTGVKDQLGHYSKYDPGTGCIEWTGLKDKNGYGRLTVKYKSCRAPRVAYEAHIGPIPEGLVVCNSFDNPACINPRHLILGTHADNIADRDRKGRHAPQHGEFNPSAKLSGDAVRAIRLETGSQKSIGVKYGISQSVVSLIKRGVRWKHIQ